SGPPVQIHFERSPLSKFTSGEAPVRLCIRNDGMPTSKPASPPSPITVLTQSFLLRFSHVPLSCVPPCRKPTSCGLTERLWNCSVDRRSFRPWSRDGIADSICLQR